MFDYRSQANQTNGESEMSEFDEIVRMSLEGNSRTDIACILDVPFEQVDEVLLAWDDMTDDERDAWKVANV
jgi:hypothetical protein